MLPHMRKEGVTVPCSVYLMVSDIIDGGQDSDKALDLHLKLFGNNKFYVTNNGSFHEYNISVWTLPSRAYYYNKYQAQAHDYNKKNILYDKVDDETYVNDYSEIYIDDDLYNIYNRYDVPWMLQNNYENNTPDLQGDRYLAPRKVSKDELPDLIERETVKAVRAWEQSRENYNESVETKKGPPDEVPCDDEDSGWSQASHILLLGGRKRHLP